MTPDTILQVALARVGLTSTSSTFKERGRQYLNMEMKDVADRTRWLWGYKGASITTVASTRAYDLEADAMDVMQFRDETNDRLISMIPQDELDQLDVDATESGDPEYVSITGLNSSTGAWSVDFLPTPDAAITISYRYYATLADLTESDDATDLGPKLPLWIQPALVFGVAAQYYREKGAWNQAQVEEGEKEKIIARGLLRNTYTQGAADTQRRRPHDLGLFDFRVQQGTLG